MKIAITGTTSGLGKALKDALSVSHNVVSFNRPDYDLSVIADLDRIDLTGFDVLINNAGHSRGGGVGFKNHSIHDWHSIISTNFQAPIYLTQKFIQQNIKGKIIFITSKALEKPQGGDSVYSAGKAGLSMFIECLRDELKDTLYTVSEVRPGRTKTDFPKNRNIHTLETLENFYDTRSHMTVDDLVKVIDFVVHNDIVNHITVEK